MTHYIRDLEDDAKLIYDDELNMYFRTMNKYERMLGEKYPITTKEYVMEYNPESNMKEVRHMDLVDLAMSSSVVEQTTENDDSDTESEVTNPENDKDLTNEYYISELTFLPLVKECMKLGMTDRQAVITTEVALVVNPFNNLYNISREMYASDDEYDNALLEAFIYAMRVTNNNTDLAAEAFVYEGIIDRVKQFGKDIIDPHSKLRRDAASKFRSGKHAVKGVVNPAVKAISDKITYLSKMDEEALREAAITGSIWPKLRRIFFKIIMILYGIPALTGLITVTGFGFWPALIAGLLGIYYRITLIKREMTGEDEQKVKSKVIMELETELKLTREKIEDARHKGDNKAKYQLMRIESKIEKEIARIKYGDKT